MQQLSPYVRKVFRYICHSATICLIGCCYYNMILFNFSNAAHQHNSAQVIMNQKKEYDLLKSRLPEGTAVYLKFSNKDTPQVKDK